MKSKVFLVSFASLLLFVRFAAADIVLQPGSSVFVDTPQTVSCGTVVTNPAVVVTYQSNLLYSGDQDSCRVILQAVSSGLRTQAIQGNAQILVDCTSEGFGNGRLRATVRLGRGVSSGVFKFVSTGTANANNPHCATVASKLTFTGDKAGAALTLSCAGETLYLNALVQ
jgi:hypothetical protein